MRMEGQDDVITVLEVLGHVGNLGSVHVGHGHLHRRRKIDDGFAVCFRLPYIEDGIANIEGKFWFRPGKAFR